MGYHSVLQIVHLIMMPRGNPLNIHSYFRATERGFVSAAMEHTTIHTGVGLYSRIALETLGCYAMLCYAHSVQKN